MCIGTIFIIMMVLVFPFQDLLINCKQCVVKNTKKQVIQYGKVEAKILCIVCYYVSLGTFVLLALTYFEATHGVQLETIMDYLECQLPGFHPSELGSNRCGDSGIPFVRLQPFFALSAIGILQLTLIPVVILGFTVRCNRKFKCCRRRQAESAQPVMLGS